MMEKQKVATGSPFEQQRISVLILHRGQKEEKKKKKMMMMKAWGKQGLESLSCQWVENCCNTSASCRAGRERMREWKCAKNQEGTSGRREPAHEEEPDSGRRHPPEREKTHAGGQQTSVRVSERASERTAHRRADKHTSSPNFARNILRTANCSRKSRNNLSQTKEALL